MPSTNGALFPPHRPTTPSTVSWRDGSATTWPMEKSFLTKCQCRKMKIIQVRKLSNVYFPYIRRSFNVVPTLIKGIIQVGIDLVCTQPRGEGGSQMRAQYINLCSNNDVIRGEGARKSQNLRAY